MDLVTRTQLQLVKTDTVKLLRQDTNASGNQDKVTAGKDGHSYFWKDRAQLQLGRQEKLVRHSYRW